MNAKMPHLVEESPFVKPELIIDNLESETEENRIADFESFVKQLDLEFVKNLRKEWNVYEKSNGICFYRLTHDEIFSNVQFSFKILVNRDMRVMLLLADTEADPEELDWILRDSKLESWTQLHRLLDHYRTELMTMENSSSIHLIKQALESLNKITKSEVEEFVDPIIKLLANALEQIESGISLAPVKQEPEEFFPVNF